MSEPLHQLLIDTDPGVDDALAILLAYAHPDARVRALTTTAGNVGLDSTTRNALKLLEVIGADTPVYPGATEPIERKEEYAAYVHGLDGFGDTGFLEPARGAEPEHAAMAMVRLARAHPGELTFVMLGPLTNLALALTLDPGLPRRVRRLVVMGGSVHGRGNLSRLPVEFNFGFDPEAAHIVLTHWPMVELVDWQATLDHGLPFGQMESWLEADNPRARFYAAISRKARSWMQRTRSTEHWHIADALAMAAVLAPEAVLERHERHVQLELDGSRSRGMSIVDWDGRGGQKENASIATRFDLERFAGLIRLALGAAPGAAPAG